MEFIPVLVDRYASDADAKAVWSLLSNRLGAVDGIAFYAHPTLGAPGQAASPDFVVLAQGYEPFVVRCVRFGLDDIDAVDDSNWTIKGEQHDSPQAILDDLVTALRHRFESVRQLRKKVQPSGVLAFPHISQAEFTKKFGVTVGSDDTAVLWQGLQGADDLPRMDEALDAAEWALAKSVFQTAHVISRATPALFTNETAATTGEAIRILERRIALLDVEQLRGALMVAPGPQRIRGLAGTGKTVLLAMKAATIHSHFPDKRILFTFHTQSLYNQTRSLITRFFRSDTGVEPDWDMVNIRHAWGGRGRPGVYSELSNSQNVPALTLPTARSRDPEMPFRACCKEALKSPIVPRYDYILVDEGQDLPAEFFQILFRLVKPPYPIVFAYDEMQNLTSVDVPKPEVLFGTGPDGKPNVSLDGEYEAGLEKDLVLYKSHRCPQEVLMVAHAVGLGLYSPAGCVQMLFDERSWNAVGYELKSGLLKNGESVVLHRPRTNSPNPISQIYKGTRPPVERQVFASRQEELDWVVKEITNDIKVEKVRPEDIVVTFFEAREARDPLQYIQRQLFMNEVDSMIPGIVADAAAFAEPGQVTLATAYRAKGNEAPIVYLVGCESVYSYAEGREARNRAFTCISRSKGWVRISGVGQRMTEFAREIDRILADVPNFKFTVPDPAKIPTLDAETTRRREEVKTAKASAEELLRTAQALTDVDPAVLAALEAAIRAAKAKQ